jgi:hypothetical protein
MAGAAEFQVTCIRESEGASSEHSRFACSNGDSVQRVRWDWNGRARNKPESESPAWGQEVRAHPGGEAEELRALPDRKSLALPPIREDRYRG